MKMFIGFKEECAITFTLIIFFLSFFIVAANSATAQFEEPFHQHSNIGLDSLLDDQGNISLPEGFSGSIDPTGFTLVNHPDEAPRFVRSSSIDGEWSRDEFGISGCNGSVRVTVVSDGELFLGGFFTGCGLTSVSNIARYNLATGEFSSLGTGVNGGVHALELIGTDLYVGGSFTHAGGIAASNIAVYDTTHSDDAGWLALGSGVNTGIQALAVIGTDLYVGGYFTMAGGRVINRIAVYDTTQIGNVGWSGLGNGVNVAVETLSVAGNKLFVGGSFSLAGSNSMNSIAVYDTTQTGDDGWSMLGNGVNGTVFATAVIGKHLYVAGTFSEAGTSAASNIAVYNTTLSGDAGWSELGAGLDSTVRALAVIGKDLYVGGDFIQAGSIVANNIAAYNTTQSGDIGWSALGSGTKETVYAISVVGTELYIGGDFSQAGDTAVSRISIFDSIQGGDMGWSTLTEEINLINDGVLALAVIGTNLYIGGRFTQAGSSAANHIAVFDTTQGGDSSWSALGSGVNEFVSALAVIGTDLYVGGSFTQAGGNAANYIAVYDTNQNNDAGWSTLGRGVNNTVTALKVIGTDLYVGGRFTEAGDNVSSHIAVYDTTQDEDAGWSTLGSGVNGSVSALEAIGTDLYVGGGFTQAGGNFASDIALFDTIQSNDAGWSALGNGVNGPVLALKSLDTDLYVGGMFTQAGDNFAQGIAVYNTTRLGDWSALGSGVSGFVFALEVIGTDLYVGGEFALAGGNPANRIAVYDSTKMEDAGWSAFGSGMNSTVATLESVGTDIYIGGFFSLAGGFVNGNIARFRLNARTNTLPDVLNFGEQSIGTTTLPQMAVIESLGPGDLIVGPISLQGPEALDYQFVNDTCSNASIPAGEACGVDVAFSVMEPGVRRAWLEIPSNSPDSPSRVDLIGTNDVVFFDKFEQD